MLNTWGNISNLWSFGFFVAHYFRIIPYLTFFAPPKERGGDYFDRCCRKHVVFSCVCSNSAPLGTTSETQKKSPKRRISALKLRESQWNSQQVPASLGHIRYLMEHLVMNNRKKIHSKKKLSKTANFTQKVWKKNHPKVEISFKTSPSPPKKPRPHTRPVNLDKPFFLHLLKPEEHNNDPGRRRSAVWRPGRNDSGMSWANNNWGRTRKGAQKLMEFLPEVKELLWFRNFAAKSNSWVVEWVFPQGLEKVTTFLEAALVPSSSWKFNVTHGLLKPGPRFKSDMSIWYDRKEFPHPTSAAAGFFSTKW